MDQTTITTNARKKKTDWQLFSNNGKFDSKLPPSQRLRRLKDQSTSNTKVNKTSVNQLKQVVNSVKIFIDPEKCHAFISTLKDEKVLVILSGLVEEKFVSNIHDAKQLESIYVFSPNKGKEETWFNQYSEIRGVYTSIVSLSEQLSKDVKKIDYNFLGFEVMERSSSNTKSKASEQDALFMYDQLFRDIVLTVPDENMQDMYEFCEKQYRGNSQEETFLKTHKKQYIFHSPVWWYTQEAFLYRMLNRALRTHQYDILYLFRVFIRHLHEQIGTLQKEDDMNQKELFRGQAMDKDDFERLRKSEGGLLSVSNFLSTSSNREVGLYFAREALKDKKKVSILMEINVQRNTTTVPVANITNLSAYSKEEEWLFSMGSVFRIGSLKRLPDGIWAVPLTLTDDKDEQLNALKEHFKKSMTDRNICLNFASLMYQLAQWRKSEYFYLKALENENTAQRRSALFNNIGLVKEELKQCDQALAYYHKSLQLKEPEGISDKASTYNNIAALYYGQNKMGQAIEYYQKAIEAANSQGNTNEELMATLNANIATILSGQGKYGEALEKCEEALTIRKKLFPAIHPSIASIYSTIASIMHRMGSHAQAIEYIQKAIDIDRQALPSDHPQLLLHTNNLELFKQQQQQQQQSN